MGRHVVSLFVVAVVLTGGVGIAGAQPVPPQKPEAVAVPLKVTVVLSRHKGDKLAQPVSRLPFELWVNTGSESTVRINADVPVPTMQPAGAPVTSFQMRSVGTSITVRALDLGEGRYRLDVSLDDNQLAPATSSGESVGPRAVMQSFLALTQPILRDGQTVQHSLATDKVTGDVIKVEVTLNVVK